jgi:hypothetical protein
MRSEITIGTTSVTMANGTETGVPVKYSELLAIVYILRPQVQVRLRGTLGAVRQPRGVSENPAWLAGLPIHPPIGGWSGEIDSGQDDLIDRHSPLARGPQPEPVINDAVQAIFENRMPRNQ